MLSRIAESVFWVGRYTERADGTARIVDQVRLTMLEDRVDGGDSAARALSVLVGEQPQEQPISYLHVAAQLVFDSFNPSSIAGSWFNARENARRAREVLPAEVWEALNAGWVRWRRFSRRDDAASPLAWTRARSALVAGLVDTTMAHDEAYNFLMLGRYLERTDTTCRIILSGGSRGRLWGTVLASSGGQQAFLRSNRGVMDDQLLASFMLLDAKFPRSVMFCLRRSEGYLERLARDQGRVGDRDEAGRLLGRVRSAMEYQSGVDLAQVPQRLVEVQEAVHEASRAVAERYFPKLGAPVWQGDQR